jgi:hypothetical protein
MNLPDLPSLLEYKNPRVLKLYEQNYPRNKLSSEQAFQETLKYLWLTRKHALDLQGNGTDPGLPRACIMLRSMQEIDEMWHEFILFTQDYTEFCHQYFGEYLHHLPNIFDNAPMPERELNSEVAKLLPYIFDNLGEETMRTWFASYLSH